MAKKKEQTNTSKENPSLIRELCDQYDKCYSDIEPLRSTWEEKEAMLLGKTLDSESKTTKSQVFVPELANIIIERAARVMAQNPTGKVDAITRKDTGKRLFMQLILDKYVIPNANQYRQFLVKNRIVDVYSNVYGSYAVLVDYFVTDSYVGPDYILIPIRDLIWQIGKHSLDESDYVFVRSVVSKKWLLDRDTKNWKNIDKVIKTSQGVKKNLDNQTYTENKFTSSTIDEYSKDDYKQIEIITRYEKDRWITFSRDGKVLLRDIPNPHNNGKFPVVMKDAFPLADRMIGLGDFERGQTLQYAANSLVNLYMDGVKMSIFPPMTMYLPDVMARTIKNEPGALWILKNNNPNAIKEFQRSPLGLNTFQSTYSFLKSGLMNIGGTTDTSISSSTDPQQGKTPQALRMQQAREAARDNWDRFMMEQFLEQVIDRFIDLIANKQEKPMKLNLMKSDLEMVAQINPDVVEMFESGEKGQVIIKPSDIKDTTYKFSIDSGSTMKQDEAIENGTLTSVIELVLKLPGAMEQMQNGGKITLGNQQIDFAELFKRWLITSGTKDWDKIVTEVKPEDMMGQGMPTQGQPMPQISQGMPQGVPPEAMGGQVANFEQPDMMAAFQGMGGQPQEQPQGLSPSSLQILEELRSGR